MKCEILGDGLLKMRPFLIMVRTEDKRVPKTEKNA